MTSVQQIIESGLVHQRSGRLDEAAKCYRQALQRAPDNSAAHYLLGLAHLRSNDLKRGLDCVRTALKLSPRQKDYLLTLANILLRSGQASEAISVLETAFRFHPESTPVMLQLGEALAETKQHAKAKLVLSRVVEMTPRNAAAHRSFGLCCLQLPGAEKEALSSLRMAAELNPTASSFNDLGYGLQRTGESRQAVDAFEKALEYDPKHRNALNNLSTALKSLGRLTEAADVCSRAVQIDPGFAVAHCNLGIALSAIGMQAEADAAFRRALKCNSQYAKAHSHLLFNLQYKPGITAAELLEAHTAYQSQQASSITMTQHIGRECPSGKPLSIGFVSDGLGRHPVGYFLQGLLEHSDTSQIEFTCYSDRHREDDLTGKLKSLVSRWRKVVGLSNAELAGVIQEDEIDILFDLSGHAGGKRMLLFARKPAPIQVTWMGYVGTTGLSAMDYLLCDHHHLPKEEEAFATETVIRLPDDYVCYTPPTYAPQVSSLACDRHGYFTFGSFNQPAKLNQPLIAQWAEILTRVKNSQLLLIYAGFDDRSVQQRVLAAFARHGIDTSRIIMRGKIPHRELLASYASVDLCLDSQPYSGGLTTCEALWMGVPVVTKTGSTFAGRHSTSHLNNVGLGEFCCQDWGEYVDLASQLASETQRLRELRVDLRTRFAASPLGNAASFARNWLELIGRTPPKRG